MTTRGSRKSIRTGRNLGQKILHIEQGKTFDSVLEKLLERRYALPIQNAQHLAESLKTADVSVCALGAVAVDSEVPKTISRRLTSIQDAYALPVGSVVLHSRLVDATERYFARDTTLKLSKPRVEELSFNLVGAFEIGRYIGRGIWHTLVERREVCGDETTDQTQEFIDSIADDVEQRGLIESGTGSGSPVGEDLVGYYAQRILPERFYSAAGVVMMESVSTAGIGRLVEYWRDSTLNSFLGVEQIEEAGYVEGYTEGPAQFELPPLTDLGALSPLSRGEFDALYLPESTPESMASVIPLNCER